MSSITIPPLLPPPPLTPGQVQEIERVLSVPRLSTYLAAVAVPPPTPALVAGTAIAAAFAAALAPAEPAPIRDASLVALELYAWNAQVSAALLTPLHICEVAIRNAVSEVLETVYGARWPWEPTFADSLPTGGRFYDHRKELLYTRSQHPATTGKVIAELSFKFWQSMFTKRFDDRLWKPHLRVALPNLNTVGPIMPLRRKLYDELETIRLLRNRIAHHEPIFTRNLAADFAALTALVRLRCQTTADWMVANQQATFILGVRP